jgi:hypothetical protein
MTNTNGTYFTSQLGKSPAKQLPQQEINRDLNVPALTKVFRRILVISERQFRLYLYT